MRQVRRILIAVAGGTVLALGVALLILPGPAFIVIPLGLGILALEYAWARRWMRRGRKLFRKKHRKFEPTKSYDPAFPFSRTGPE